MRRGGSKKPDFLGVVPAEQDLAVGILGNTAARLKTYLEYTTRAKALVERNQHRYQPIAIEHHLW